MIFFVLVLAAIITKEGSSLAPREKAKLQVNQQTHLSKQDDVGEEMVRKSSRFLHFFPPSSFLRCWAAK